MSTDPRAGAAPTLADVATEAGVSRATASRVFTNDPRVAPHRRQAVERAAVRLGYVPNLVARSLRTRRAGSIGMVIPETAWRVLGDPYFPRLLTSTTRALNARELQLALFLPQTEADHQRLEGFVTGGHLDGVLLVSHHATDPMLDRLMERRVPVVAAGRPLRRQDVIYADVDNEGGASAAVAHLLQRGRRVIGTITGPDDMAAGVERLAGYRRALDGAGAVRDPDLVAAGDFTYEGGAAATSGLLARRPDLDAIFAANDLMAYGALDVLREAGRRVPEDVALVGFDDITPLSRLGGPPLTTVSQPIEALGEQIVDLLLKLIEQPGEPPRHVILSTRLVPRASSSAG